MGVLILKSSAAPASAITPELIVEYVDTSGVRQRTTVVDGVTSISGVAPFFVHFDATGTRSTVTGGTTEEGGVRRIGYHFQYGEALGTTWAYPAGMNYSMDEDFGFPIAGRIFTTTGTKTVTMTCRDSAGNEADVSFSVVLSAPPAATHIPVSNGAWPTWTSSTHYTLDRGGDYTSFGSISMSEVHNILISATGSGAAPIVGTVIPENLSYKATGTANRSKNIRFLNIDIAQWGSGGTQGAVGYEYCCAHGGRVRTYAAAAHSFMFDDRATNGTQSQAESISFNRGLMFCNTGQMVANGSYVFIETARAVHFYGVEQVHSGAGYEHNTRGVWSHSCWRYGNMYNLTDHKSYLKAQGLEQWDGGEPTAWRSDNRVGDYAGGAELGRYGYPGHKTVWQCMQFGASGEDVPDQTLGFAPQNSVQEVTGVEVEGVELCGVEDSVFYAASDTADLGDEPNLGGKNLFVRNLRYNLGAGGYVGYSEITGGAAVKVPSGWATGYLGENANTRPIPSTL